MEKEFGSMIVTVHVFTHVCTHDSTCIYQYLKESILATEDINFHLDSLFCACRLLESCTLTRIFKRFLRILV